MKEEVRRRKRTKGRAEGGGRGDRGDKADTRRKERGEKGRREEEEEEGRWGSDPYLVEVVLGHLQGSVEEVEDVAGVLDPVLGRLLRGGEAVVAGAAEVLVAAGSVLQPIGLPGHDGLLLGDTAREGKWGGGLSTVGRAALRCHPPSHPGTRPTRR